MQVILLFKNSLRPWYTYQVVFYTLYTRFFSDSVKLANVACRVSAGSEQERERLGSGNVGGEETQTCRGESFQGGLTHIAAGALTEIT